VSGLEPPLPYEDESFAAVLGLSVMTHLRRECQLRWLEEICRVLRPGGVLLATVHGKAAHNFFGVEHVEGLDDRYLDPYMAEVLPADYYRTVLQTETYTRDTWSTDEFPVTGYYASAIGNHDLVVLNKK
jgi:SAM-dependent methyltransferase